MKYSLVIFDFDGTLCMTKEALVESFQSAYRIFNHTTPSTSAIEQHITQGIPTKDVLNALTPDIDVQKVFQVQQEQYGKIAMDKTYLFPHVVEVLKQLQAATVINIVVSNKEQHHLESAVKHFGLQNYFRKIIGVRPEGYAKPDLNVYKHYVQPHFPDIPTDKILMVGDTDKDILFANAMQCSACWASYGEGVLDRTKIPYEPRYTITNLLQLLDIVLHQI